MAFSFLLYLKLMTKRIILTTNETDHLTLIRIVV